MRTTQIKKKENLKKVRPFFPLPRRFLMRFGLWSPNSDCMHEILRKFGYEFGNMCEREPRGRINCQIIKYKKDEDRQVGTSPVADVRESIGYTLNEALLAVLVEVISKGDVES